jgi:hypothetical protein
MKEKQNLTISEQRRHSHNVERLQRAGIATGIDDAVSSAATPPDVPPVKLQQSEFGELYAGTLKGIALAIPIRMLVLRSGLTIIDSEIAIAGCAACIFLVPPPATPLSYRVFRWIDIERGVVLNHLFCSERPLPVHTNLGGILIAQSFDSLPHHFKNGTPIHGTLRFCDQHDRWFETEIELRLQWCKQSQGSHASGPKRDAYSAAVVSPVLSSDRGMAISSSHAIPNSIGGPCSPVKEASKVGIVCGEGSVPKC